MKKFYDALKNQDDPTYFTDSTGTYKIDLSEIVDNTVTTIIVPTPKGWKCKKKGCPTRFKHEHSTYSCLYDQTKA